MNEKYFLNYSKLEKAINTREIAYIEQGLGDTIIFTLKSGVEKTWKYTDNKFMEDD